ncbi:MAG: hypothetical protein IIX72_05030, partial [Oscillospiraceae bacterium]|nr:hypothetical protein [Oscillospiraceae bacterium]
MTDFLSFFNLIAFLFFAAVVMAALYKELHCAPVRAAEVDLHREKLLVMLVFFAALIMRLWGL